MYMITEKNPASQAFLFILQFYFYPICLEFKHVLQQFYLFKLGF